MAITNENLWNEIRSKYPSFASHTAEGTAALFTERGWESLRRSDADAINEFFKLSLQVALIGVNTARVKDTLEDKGFGEYFDAPFGGIVQKISINSVKPVSPRYRGYKDGDSVDPFTVRLPKVEERFFVQNFDYQSFITMPDDFAKKTIFVSPYGMEDFVSGIMQALNNGYREQKFLNKLEALSKGLNSSTHPLKDTQKYEVSQAGNSMTSDELVQLVLAVKNIVSAMTLAPATGAYNAIGFESTQDVDRLKLLIRPGYKNLLDVMVLANAYNQERLNLPIEVIEVPNFGGIEYYSDANFTSKLYKHYNSTGECDGWTTSEKGKTLYTGDVYAKDTNASTIAMVADKGYIFECQQNPYTVEPARNPAGMYSDFWASCPGSTIAVDSLHNAVAIQKKS